MAGSKTLVFNPQNLLALLVHYTDGGVPLNAELKNVLVHPSLTRMVALEVSSDEWTTSDPLHIRYEGNKTMTWTKGDEKPNWQDMNTPTRQ